MFSIIMSILLIQFFIGNREKKEHKIFVLTRLRKTRFFFFLSVVIPKGKNCLDQKNEKKKTVICSYASSK